MKAEINIIEFDCVVAVQYLAAERERRFIHVDSTDNIEVLGEADFAIFFAAASPVP